MSKSESLTIQKVTRKCILLRNNMRKWNKIDGEVSPAFEQAEKVLRKRESMPQGSMHRRSKEDSKWNRRKRKE